MSKFEAVILLSPDLSSENLKQQEESFKKLLIGLSGSIFSKEDWGLRNLSYKNISMDTTDGRTQIADELLKASKPTKPVYVYESPDGGNTIYRREFGKDKRNLTNRGNEIYFLICINLISYNSVF